MNETIKQIKKDLEKMGKPEWCSETEYILTKLPELLAYIEILETAKRRWQSMAQKEAELHAETQKKAEAGEKLAKAVERMQLIEESKEKHGENCRDCHEADGWNDAAERINELRDAVLNAYKQATE